MGEDGESFDTPSVPPERWIADEKPAAIRYKDLEGREKIYRGQSHAGALGELSAEHGIKVGSEEESALLDKLSNEGSIGFMTNAGEYVDRYQAGQIVGKPANHPLDSGEL